VSVVDFVALLNRKASTEDLRAELERASINELKGIMACESEPLVSVDFKATPILHCRS